MNLKGRCAFITGATAGIGAATARALAHAGCDLVLVGRREDRLATLAQEFKTKVTVHAFALDVRDAKAFQDLAQKQRAILERVDILVNNAGLALGVDKIQNARVSDWQTMIETNITALFRITHWFVPQLMACGRGDIVNLGSVAGRYIYPGGAVYCATKHAVRAFSEGLRMDLLGSNVRVINIEPGMVETEFSNVRLGDEAKAKNVYAGMTPLVAEDIAQTILWTLARPRHVNIQELVIYPTDQASPQVVHRRPNAN